MNSRLLIVLFFVSSSLAKEVSAQSEGVLAEQVPYRPELEWNTSTLGLGGARSSFADDAGAVNTNPAALAYLLNRVTLEGSGGIFNRDEGNQMIFSVTDGQTGPVVGSAQFLRYDSEQFRKYSYSASVAYPYKFLSVGATSRLVDYGKLSDLNRVWLNNFGLIAAVSNIAYFSAAVRNVGIKTVYPDPLLVQFGVSVNWPSFLRISGETDRPFDAPNGVKKEFNVSSGAEIMVAKYGLIRGGYRWDRMYKRSFWTVGAALHAERSTLAFTYMREKESPKNSYNFQVRIVF